MSFFSMENIYKFIPAVKNKIIFNFHNVFVKWGVWTITCMSVSNILPWIIPAELYKVVVCVYVQDRAKLFFILLHRSSYSQLN